MEPATVFAERPVVVLSEDDMELWDRAKKSFGRCKRIFATKLTVNVRVGEMQHLKELGLILRRGSQVFKADVTVIPATRPFEREFLEAAQKLESPVENALRVYDDAATISRTSWDNRVRFLSEDDRVLLGICLDNINPKYHNSLVARIMANEVYKYGYGPDDLSALMLALNFDPRGANYALPVFLVQQNG